MRALREWTPSRLQIARNTSCEKIDCSSNVRRAKSMTVASVPNAVCDVNQFYYTLRFGVARRGGSARRLRVTYSCHAQLLAMLALVVALVHH